MKFLPPTLAALFTLSLSAGAQQPAASYLDSVGIYPGQTTSPALFLSGHASGVTPPAGLTLSFAWEMPTSGFNIAIGSSYLEHSAAEWRWQALGLNGGPQRTPMKLGDNGTLTLAGNAPITLNPTYASIMIGNASVITSATASMYSMPASPTRVAVAGGSVASYSSLALGPSSVASANYAVATGEFAKASAQDAVAMGYDVGASARAATAFGWGTRAAGLYSFAAGNASYAGGVSSVAMGQNAYSNGLGSVAIGKAVQAHQLGAVSMGNDSFSTEANAITVGGWNTASGYGAAAIGSGNFATGVGSFAVGWQSKANGNNAMAIGTNCKATGTSSIAMGLAEASGEYSGAFGFMNRATTPHQFVVGAYNAPLQAPTPVSQTSSTDHLFVVGNGYVDAGGVERRSNAFVVKRNGDVAVSGVIRVPQAGNLSMGEFTAGGL